MVLSNENDTEGTMSARKRMSAESLSEYLAVMHQRYLQADRKGRSKLLDELQAVTGRDRKHLIKLMSKGHFARKERGKERGSTYGLDVRHALSVIAEALDYICPERLHGNLVWLAKHLEAQGELMLSPQLLEQLERISVSTIRRLLAAVAKDQYFLPRPKPRPGSAIARQIPMTRLPWDEAQPGHFEVDLVFHSGDDASGEFACSLHMVDVATGWSEIAAILGRSQLVVGDGFQRILDRLPFPVLQLHPDNGGEFLNDHLLRLWRDWVPQLTWSRSRPYRKNDNRFVEAKHFPTIRRLLGYQRLDTVEQVNAMNELYEMLRLYHNLFQPVMRLTQKETIMLGDGSYRLRRRYGQPQTPFDRLCATDAIAEETRQALQQQRQVINPRKLRVQILEKADAILRMPSAKESPRSQNVYLTLHIPAQVVATAAGVIIT